VLSIGFVVSPLEVRFEFFYFYGVFLWCFLNHVHKLFGEICGEPMRRFAVPILAIRCFAHVLLAP
jgi:hypothetical protein